MLFGERTRLRRVERSDLPRIVGWLNDPEVREHLLLVYPLGLGEEERWYDDVSKHEPAAQPFLVEIPADGHPGSWTPIGVIGFHEVSWRTRAAELGVVLGDRSAWGKGYGTDATRALLRWGFDELNLNRAWLRVFEDNARAIRSYEKLGFRLEGRLRQDRFHGGRYSDTLILGLLRGELT